MGVRPESVLEPTRSEDLKGATVDDSSSITEHLFQAALRYLEHGDVQGLRAVLLSDPALALAGEKGRGEVLIRAAIETGRLDMLEALLDAGADPNMPEGKRIEDDGDTTYQPGYVPLHYAAKEGLEEMVDLLLERGANPSAADYWGGTPLHSARSARIAEALLKAGANPNADCHLRKYNDTFSWYFIGPPLHVAARCGDVEMLRKLIAYGANIDHRDFVTGHTALHFAAESGNAEAVKVLLKLGASPNRLDNEPYRENWFTPLHLAAQQGNKLVVGALLKAGANVHIKGGPAGKTAAELALENGHSVVAAKLARASTGGRKPTGIRTRKAERS